VSTSIRGAANDGTPPPWVVDALAAKRLCTGRLCNTDKRGRLSGWAASAVPTGQRVVVTGVSAEVQRWTAGGQMPLDAAARGSTPQHGAPSLISSDVSRPHHAAPVNMIALGLVMRRSQVRVARDFSGTFSSVGGTSEGVFAVQERKAATALKGPGLRARASAPSLRNAPAWCRVGRRRRGSSGRTRS
jgi:hypothetical protein